VSDKERVPLTILFQAIQDIVDDDEALGAMVRTAARAIVLAVVRAELQRREDARRNEGSRGD